MTKSDKKVEKSPLSSDENLGPEKKEHSSGKKETVEEINFVSSLDSALSRNIEIYIEATGNPIAGTLHAHKIIEAKKNGF